MILFTILALLAIIAVIGVVAAAGTFGVAVIAVFGDVIVCALVLYIIIKIVKLIFGRKR